MDMRIEIFYAYMFGGFVILLLGALLTGELVVSFKTTKRWQWFLAIGIGLYSSVELGMLLEYAKSGGNFWWFEFICIAIVVFVLYVCLSILIAGFIASRNRKH